MKECWIGKTIGPLLVVDRFRNNQGRNAYVCEHIETRRIKGITAHGLNRMIREGRETMPDGVIA